MQTPNIPAVDTALLAELEKIQGPEALLKTLFEKYGGRAAIASSGQLSDSVLTHMAAQAVPGPRIYTVDTRRIFPETLALFDELEKKYKIKIERYAPDAAEVKKMVDEHGEYLFFDSKEKQEMCCTLRKVVPNERALDGLDVWITGLRRDQSPDRRNLPRLEIIQRGGRPLLKVNPLFDWKEAQVREFCKRHDIPIHAFFAKPLPNGWYYESLGCVICTTPIGPYEPRRAGRWRWFNHLDSNKECGLHLPPPPTPPEK